MHFKIQIALQLWTLFSQQQLDRELVVGLMRIPYLL